MDAYPARNVGVEPFNTSIGFTPSTWPVNTKLTLCNVPWDSDYRDVVRFATSSARDAYFNSLAGKKAVTEHATYCKPNEPVSINVPYSAAYTYNYLIVENPAQPVQGEVTPPKLYYFVVGVSMINPNNTRLWLQLDVWMTYQVGLEIGRAFVERGHVALHAWRNTSLSGNSVKSRRYLMAPEGLDVGASYIETDEQQFSIVSSDDFDMWYYLIVSAVDLETSNLPDKFGTVDNPKLPMARGMTIDGMKSACEMYMIAASGFSSFVNNLRNYPWISNQILNITAVPGNYVSIGGAIYIAGVSGFKAPTTILRYSSLTSVEFSAGNVSTFLAGQVSTKWAAHPKARVWPFSWIKCDNQISQPLTLTLEGLAGDTLDFNVFFSSIPPYQRIIASPKWYGTTRQAIHSPVEQNIPSGGTRTQQTAYGDKFASGLVWTDFPQVAILNDAYINYLASNANSLAYARDNAGWNLDKSLANINTSYDNAYRSLGAAQANQQAAYETQRDISRYNMGNLVGNQLKDTFNSLSSGAQGAFNNVFGGADVSAIINTTVNAATGATANELGNLQFQTTQAAQQGNIDANYALQQWAARGDYEQAIAGIDASVRDARMLPPTQSGMFSGGMFALLASRGLAMMYVCAMTVTEDYQNKISDFWNRYGYAVGEYIYIGQNFLLNKRFTYWKCLDTTIALGNLDEGSKNVIRGIFEKGVTVWASASDITSSPTTTLTDNAALAGTALY